MKIKPEHLDALRAAIAPLDTPERRQQYRDDTHIDTALRAIVPIL